MNKKTKVINLFGGPGIGKSTVSAGLFHLMKSNRLDVELVTEFAKDLVWEGQSDFLRKPDMIYIFAQQNRRLSRLDGKVEYVINDSPLLLSQVYTNPDQTSRLPSMLPFFIDVWHSYTNINVVLQRATEFVEEGRAHSQEESIAVDWKIREVLEATGSKYVVLPLEVDTPKRILELCL